MYAKLFEFSIKDKGLYSITRKARCMTKTISFISGVADWPAITMEACIAMIDSNEFLKVHSRRKSDFFSPASGALLLSILVI